MNRSERRQQVRQEYEKASAQASGGKKSSKKLMIYSAIIIAVIGIAGLTVYQASAAGKYDSFAKCLAEKGAVMYGAMNWCKYTQEQRAMFGKSYKYLNYKEYTEGEGIKITPTWIINGERYEKVQSFEKLAALTGCSL